MYGPYTGRYFSSRRDTDIEHMVAMSEAHDSGLCAADAGTKRRFASDLLNLTLGAPAMNRHRKRGKDAGEWMAQVNRFRFGNRIVPMKREYALTVDWREARTQDGVLLGFDRDVHDIRRWCNRTGQIVLGVARRR